MNLNVQEFSSYLQQVLETYLADCEEPDNSMKAFHELLVNLHNKTNFYSSEINDLSATNQERRRNSNFEDGPITLNTDVLYKVIKGAEAEGKLKTIEALIDDQTSKDDEESWEKENQEHQNICCYEYLMQKVCTAWGEDTSITDRTANDFFQMRYVE